MFTKTLDKIRGGYNAIKLLKRGGYLYEEQE